MRISQIVTSSKIKFSKNVRAFTEQGVAMFTPLNAKFIYPGWSLFLWDGVYSIGVARASRAVKKVVR